ncbi:MAG: hypothetical protein WA979_14735 [Pacificimonas sp.]
MTPLPVVAPIVAANAPVAPIKPLFAPIQTPVCSPHVPRTVTNAFAPAVQTSVPLTIGAALETAISTHVRRAFHPAFRPDTATSLCAPLGTDIAPVRAGHGTDVCAIAAPFGPRFAYALASSFGAPLATSVRAHLATFGPHLTAPITLSGCGYRSQHQRGGGTAAQQHAGKF